MANSPAEDIRSLLDSEGVDDGGTWHLATGLMPESPAKAVATYDTGGPDPNSKWGFDRSEIQVRVRGDRQEYSTTYQKALAIKNLLLGRDNTTIGSTEYFLFIQVGDIIFLGYDDNYRPSFSLNWRIHRTPDEIGNRSQF